MTRLIDDLISRKALLEELKSFLSYSTKLLNNNGHSNVTEFIESYHADMERLITNAPTVQREGWRSVDELQKVYDDMFSHKDIARVAQSLWNLIYAK